MKAIFGFSLYEPEIRTKLGFKLKVVMFLERSLSKHYKSGVVYEKSVQLGNSGKSRAGLVSQNNFIKLLTIKFLIKTRDIVHDLTNSDSPSEKGSTDWSDLSTSNSASQSNSFKQGLEKR